MFIIAIKFNIIENYTFANFINNLLPSTINNYWFIKMYIVVYLLSDSINYFISSLTKTQYKNTLILLFLIFSVSTYLTGGKFFDNNGYNFFNFIFIYMIGGYLRRYPLKDAYCFKNFSANGYKIILCLTFLVMGLTNLGLVKFAYDISDCNSVLVEVANTILYSYPTYSTPFVIIQTICYFALFETLNIKSKVINFISSCTFGIYLFHDNPNIRISIYKILKIDNGTFSDYNMLIKMFAVVIIIFIIGIIIEMIRKLLVYLCFKLKFVKKAQNKMKEFIESFNYEINW